MDNHFNTPAEVIDLSIKACENKTRLPLGKMILLGIMAGAFIPFGGATSSTAAHAERFEARRQEDLNLRPVLVKHFCNTLFDKYLSVTSFHWC